VPAEEGGAILGEVLAESSGQITGYRVLAAEGQDSKVEVSFQGRGSMLGAPMSDTGTYWQVIRPGGTLYGEGQVLMMTEEGEVAPWRGFGVGRPTGRPPAATFGVAGAFYGASGSLSRLGTVANVVEYEIDEEANYRWTMWEWRGQQAG
jgi:hypothetical protein